MTPEFSEEFLAQLQENVDRLDHFHDQVMDNEPGSMLAGGRHYPALDHLIEETMEILRDSIEKAVEEDGRDAAMAERAMITIALETLFCVGFRSGEAAVEMVPCPGSHGSLSHTKPKPGMERWN